jgi:hypothetical protein
MSLFGLWSIKLESEIDFQFDLLEIDFYSMDVTIFNTAKIYSGKSSFELLNVDIENSSFRLSGYVHEPIFHEIQISGTLNDGQIHGQISLDNASKVTFVGIKVN